MTARLLCLGLLACLDGSSPGSSMASNSATGGRAFRLISNTDRGPVEHGSVERLDAEQIFRSSGPISRPCGRKSPHRERPDQPDISLAP
jgi:hypothetical protein